MAKLNCPIAITAQQFPELPALRDAGFVLSYAQLDQRLLSLQQQLRECGLSRGDHLFISSPNCWQFVLLLWACWREGIVACPVNPAFPQDQQLALKKRVHAHLAWPSDSMPLQFDTECVADDQTKTTIQLDSETLSNLIFTSGSSGAPKIVAHRLGNHFANAQGSAVPLSQGDGWLLSLPLFHVGGLGILFRCFLAGSYVCLPDRTQTLAAQLSSTPITHLSLVPTQLYRLLHQADFHFSQTQVKHLLLGGAPIPESLTIACQAQGLEPWVSYGLSEMASQVCTARATEPGIVGSPLSGREVCIINGEICVKGETLFAGYYQPDGHLNCPVDDAGWFHTGDAGHWKDHALFIEGRRDNQFISGGENIQPEQIEQQLIQHPAIAQAIVVPTPDDEWGMRVTCFIDWYDAPLSHSDVADWLRQTLPGYLIPKTWLPWPELPTGTLKLPRAEFKRRALQSSSSHSTR